MPDGMMSPLRFLLWKLLNLGLKPSPSKLSQTGNPQICASTPPLVGHLSLCISTCCTQDPRTNPSQMKLTIFLFLWPSPLQASHWGVLLWGYPHVTKALSYLPPLLPAVTRTCHPTHFGSSRQSERSHRQGPQSACFHLCESPDQVHSWTWKE